MNIFKRIIRKIKTYNALVHLAYRHRYEVREFKPEFGSKKELLKFISDSLGDDWNKCASFSMDANLMKVTKYYVFNKGDKK